MWQNYCKKANTHQVLIKHYWKHLQAITILYYLCLKCLTASAILKWVILSFVLGCFISNIVGNIFKVVSYQEVNLGAVSFSCKRCLKSIVLFLFPTLERQYVKVANCIIDIMVWNISAKLRMRKQSRFRKKPWVLTNY